MSNLPTKKQFYFFQNHGDEEGNKGYTICYGDEEEDDENAEHYIVSCEDDEDEAIEACKRLNDIVEPLLAERLFDRAVNPLRERLEKSEKEKADETIAGEILRKNCIELESLNAKLRDELNLSDGMAVQSLNGSFEVIKELQSLNAELVEALKTVRTDLLDIHGVFGGGQPINNIYDKINAVLSRAESKTPTV